MRNIRLAGALWFLGAAVAFAADPALLGYLPGDSRGLAGIYVDKAAASPMGQFVLSQVKEDARLQKLIETTGFDPRRDLGEVVVALKDPTGKQAGMLAARGVFNAAQIIAEAKSHGAVSETYKGTQLLRIGRDGTLLAFPGTGIVLAGPQADVKAALDRQGQPSTVSPALLARVNQFSAANDAWFVTDVPTSSFIPSRPGTNAPQIGAQALQAIQQTSGGIRFGTMVEFNGEAIARTDKDAQALVDVFRFMTGLLQMQGQKNPQSAKVFALLNNVNVSAEASTVRIAFSIPQKDVEELIKPRRQLQKASLQNASR